jgi:ATP-dependent protease HslVU (ClpYQ) peptidase subunit
VTTIAAIQGSSWVVMGYDSQVSEDAGRKYELPHNSGKCFPVGDYLIGVAGDFRAVNVLMHNFRPPDVGKNSGEDLDRFMTSKFIPSLKKCFDDNFYGKDSEQGSLLLVAVNATVYEIGGNYDCMRESNGVYAIGSGGGFALGAMLALESGKRKTMKNAKDSITSAISIAATLDSGTSEPIMMVTQTREEES